MPQLLSVQLLRSKFSDGELPDEFPFCLPVIRTLPQLAFSCSVTLFAGDNGSGKSTILESLAIAAELPILGSGDGERDLTLAPQRELARHLRLVWRRRSRRGFFLRAEDFFGYLKQRARDDARIARERGETLGSLTASDLEERALISEHVDETAARRYIGQYDSRSHGESFLDIFLTRLRGDGLYILDEPETPLSPERQLQLVHLMYDAAERGAQFIVATHSPILLAYPGAQIFSVDAAPIRSVDYADLPQVSLMRDFLNEPARYLRYLEPSGDRRTGE